MRLEELHWTAADLAREVERLQGAPMTRAGIAHVLQKAKRSGLVPVIEKAIGWRAQQPEPIPTVAELAAEAGATIEPERAGMMQRLIEDIHKLAGSPAERELNDIYMELDGADQDELMNFARALRSVRRAERRKTAAIEEAQQHRDLVAAKLGAIRSQYEHASASAAMARVEVDIVGMNETHGRARVRQLEELLADLHEQETAALKQAEDAAEKGRLIEKQGERAMADDLRRGAEAGLASAREARARAEARLHAISEQEAKVHFELVSLQVEYEEAQTVLARRAADRKVLDRLRKQLGIPKK